MILRALNKEELKRAFERDLTEAFPPSELKPLAAMERMRDAGVYDPLGLYEEGNEEPLGYALMWRHPTEEFVLLDYLCVPKRQRNGGIGGKLVQALVDYYPVGTVLIGESEAPVGDPAVDEMILRRLGFYGRTGAVTIPYDTALFGVHFKTICWSRGQLPADDIILQRHYEIYRNQFTEEQMRRYVQIPLHPGEKPFPRQDWVSEEGRSC